MGRRSRNRSTAGPDADPGAAPARSRPFGGRDNLTPARRVLAAYVVAAGALGVMTLAGIATLGGDFGPIIVFLLVLALALFLQRVVSRRIEGLELSEEDRLMRLLATGVLATAVVLALVSAAVSLVVD